MDLMGTKYKALLRGEQKVRPFNSTLRESMLNSAKIKLMRSSKTIASKLNQKCKRRETASDGLKKRKLKLSRRSRRKKRN